MTRTTASLLFLAALCTALAACGDSTSMVDMGTLPDSGADAGADLGAPDLGAPDLGIVRPPGTTCDLPMVVTGDVSSVVSVSFDTTGDPPGMRDLGEHCANPDPGMMGLGRFPPQGVVEYHVAGTGPQRVDVSTDNPVTAAAFDTVLQVRTTCTMVPPDRFPFTCFDVVGGGNLRSSGSVTAMGGSTLYVFVTGYANDPTMSTTVDRGPTRVDFTQHPASAPTESAAQANLVGNRFEISATGMDADGDAVGMIAHLRDAAGMPVDLNGDGVKDGYDDVILLYAPAVTGMTSFSGAAQVAQLVAAGTTAKSAITTAGATQAAVTVFDQGSLESAPIMVPLTTITLVDPGTTCDDTHRCWVGATCDATAMTCMLDPATATACGAATPIAVATPTDTTTTASVAGSVAGGTGGMFEGSCGQATKPESIYTVDVPSGGDYDLIVGTDGSSGSPDTVLYVRSACGNPEGEVGCNDDVDYAGGVVTSKVEILDAPAGTYAAFVEAYNAAVSYTVHADLRPVLPTGAACDGAGRMNRCATAACPVTTHVCP